MPVICKLELDMKGTKTFLISASLILALSALQSFAAPSESQQVLICRRELENANRTLGKWAESMENMVNESKLSASVREATHNEANKILDMIEDFGEQVRNKPAAALAKDLVNIRRRSNRMALDIYLNTFDMRWPQSSLALGVTVERVQQACLDRNTIQALESPPNPLLPLRLKYK